MWHLDSSSSDEAEADVAAAHALAAPAPAQVPEPFRQHKRRGRPPGSRKLEVVLKRRRSRALEAGAAEVPQVPVPAPGAAEAAEAGHAAPQDNGVYHQLQHAIDPRRLGMCSATTLGRAVGLDTRRVTDHLVVMADTAICSVRDAIQCLMQRLAGMQDRIRLVSFLNWRRYDETPLKLAVRWPEWGKITRSRFRPGTPTESFSATALPNPACCRGAYLANVTLNASTFRTLSEKLAVGCLGGISTNEFLNQAAHSGMLPRG